VPKAAVVKGLRRGARLLGVALLCAAAAVRADAAGCSGWPAWEAFRTRFVSDDGRVIDWTTPRRHTVSEAQAYALLFALAADDRLSFDRVLTWTKNNLAQGDLTRHLPAWQWGQREDGSYGPLDANAATDADLWIAYALAEGGRIWREPTLTALSHALGAQILRDSAAELPGLGLVLLPGPVGFADANGGWRLNPSYLPLQALRGLAGAHPDQRALWLEVVGSSIAVLQQSAPGGYAPDWVHVDGRGAFGFDEQAPPVGSYGAIRVYLWLGLLDPADPARATLLKQFEPMARRIARDGQPAERIDASTGAVLAPRSPGSFSAAVAPWLQQVDARTARRQWQRAARLMPDPDSYYSNALLLLAQGWREGRLRFDAEGRLLRREAQCRARVG